jgi:hypothetical protein
MQRSVPQLNAPVRREAKQIVAGLFGRVAPSFTYPPPGIHQSAQPAPPFDAVAAHTVAIETCERYLQS